MIKKFAKGSYNIRYKIIYEGKRWWKIKIFSNKEMYLLVKDLHESLCHDGSSLLEKSASHKVCCNKTENKSIKAFLNKWSIYSKCIQKASKQAQENEILISVKGGLFEQVRQLYWWSTRWITKTQIGILSQNYFHPIKKKQS